MGHELSLRVLGPVRAWRGETSVPLGRVGQRAVLGLLALAGERPMTRAELVDALWPDAPPPSAANVLQTHLRRLRQALEPERPARAPSAVLPTVGDGYALRLPADAVDAGRFRHLVATGAELANHGEHASAAVVLGSALDLWHGPPLADVPFLATHPAVVMLIRERQAARTRYAEAMIAADAAVDALRMLAPWTAEDPLDEAAHALLIRALHLTGQRRQAFAVYREIRRRLVDELGVEPGPALAAAHAEALYAPDPMPAAGGVGAASPFFIVRDLQRALVFYRDRLGFDVTFTGPDGEPFFAVVRRGNAQFLLKVVGEGVAALPNRARHPYARWDAFVYVSDPDSLAAEFGMPIADTDDGLRGFEVTDADGYVLFFGGPR